MKKELNKQVKKKYVKRQWIVIFFIISDYSSSNRNQGSPLPSKPNFAPPKPPSSRSALPPIPPSRAGHSSSVSKEGVPPAPPLPPSAPPAYYAPPPPHSKPSNESRPPPVCSGRSGLLDDIVKFKGSALKPVDHSQVCCVILLSFQTFILVFSYTNIPIFTICFNVVENADSKLEGKVSLTYQSHNEGYSNTHKEMFNSFVIFCSLY
jgi:hypothetical protein